MKNSVWITFWTLVLLDYDFANPIPKTIILDMDFEYENLKKIVCPNSTLYTPTNIKVECIVAALNCSYEELRGVVKHECDDPKQAIDPTLELLEIVISKTKSHNLDGTNDCACERWPETPYEEFLERIRSLLQLSNSLFA